MQEKATKLYVRVNATQPASGVALRFLIQEGNFLAYFFVKVCYNDLASLKYIEYLKDLAIYLAIYKIS